MRLQCLFYLLLSIICCAGTTDAFCQPIENHFTHYTTKDGLAEGRVTSITQDTMGFLWLSTQNGLCRFDGNTFKTYRYNQADTNSIRENILYGVFIDSNKRLWAYTKHWLYLYHPEGEWFEHFAAPELIAYRCYEDKGQLIVTTTKGLCRFDREHKTFVPIIHEGIDPLLIHDHKIDEHGIEWFGTERGLIRRDPFTKKNTLIDSTHSWHDKKEIAAVITIILLPDDYLLASFYEDGFFLLNRKTGVFKEYHTDQINPDAPLPKVDPSAPAYKRTDYVYKLNDSIILLSASGGITTFNWRRETFSYFRPNKSEPASLLESDIRIFSMFCDREGILWLGGQYLEKYDYKDFAINMFPGYGHQQKDKQFAPYYDLYRCRNGKFLMGSYEGMGIYDPTIDQLINNDDKINYDGKYPMGKINYFNEGANGTIWCYSQRSVRSFNIVNNVAKNIKQYKIPGKISGIYVAKMDSKGRILVATDGAGLAVFDTSSKTFSFFSASSGPSQLTSSSSTSICEDHNGCIWVGTLSGLNKIEKDGITIKQYSQNKNSNTKEPDWWVRDIAEDRYGVIWFTTIEHGIGRIDPRNDSVSFYSTAQGMPTCQFDQICIDEQDNLWATSTMGIVNMNVVTLQNKLCTEDEGFPLPGDINAISYSKLTKKCYILTPYSIFEVNAKDSTRNYNIPQTIITGFSVFNEPYPFSLNKEIDLAYNENFINIEFAALLFHSNRQIKYAYKMEGIDKDWVYCNYKRNASYTNLPTGHYTFWIKAQSPQGVWNKPTQLSIVIKPPFWQRWWFYLAEMLCIAAFIFWITRLYTSRKLAKQKIEIEKILAVSHERNRIASDLHDELGAGLTFIRMLSEIAGGKMKNEGNVKTEIEKIEKSATNLSENLREIIWTMNTQFDKLEDFIFYIRSYAVEYFDDSSINFQFHSPAAIPEITLSGELRRNIFLCIKEALNNIIKHSQATEASLTFSIEANIMTITIADNGVGINTAHANKFGNGLNTMKERIAKFGSSLQIDVSGGTKLIFKIIITP